MTDIRIIVPLGVRGAQASLGFPRVAAVIISGWPTGDHDTADIDRYALANWTTLNFSSSTSHPRVVPGTGGLNDQEILDRMRGVNPDIVLMNWVNAIHTFNDPNGTHGPYVTDYIADLEARDGPTPGPNPQTDWYGYKTDGITLAGGDFGSNFFLNWSTFVNADVSGDKLAGFTAKKRFDDNYQNADWNGYQVDVQRTEPNGPAQNIDFDQDGDTDESALTGGGATLYKEYEAAFVVEMNALITGSDHLVMGNNGNTWVPARNKVTPKPEYVGMDHGGLWEGAMGKSFSADILNPGDVTAWKNQIGKPWFEYCNLNDQPGLSGLFLDLPAATPSDGVAPMVMFGTVVDAAEYDYVRYYSATCLMCDGYINIQPDIGPGWTDWVLFDEYHRGVDNIWNWLGLPVDSMIDTSVDAAWSLGVYAREFENGAVFVNPDGNGNQSIDMTTFKGGLWKRINGTQAPTVNTGNDITGAETLNEKDGLLVVRQ